MKHPLHDATFAVTPLSLHLPRWLLLTTHHLPLPSLQLFRLCLRAGGDQIRALNWMFKRGGLAPQAAYPYQGVNNFCRRDELQEEQFKGGSAVGQDVLGAVAITGCCMHDTKAGSV